MKGFIFIMACFMLLLSVLPCSDGFNDAHDDFQVVDSTHNHQEDTDDSCPITCICNCCGTTIAFEVLKPFSIHTKISISTEVHTEYESNYRFDFLNSIWQPPQVIS